MADDQRVRGIVVAAAITMLMPALPALADARFHVSAGPGNRSGCDHGGQSILGASLPALAHHACADAIGMTTADAEASFGRVGASTAAATLVDFPTIQREDVARARFTDTLVLSKLDPTAPDVVPISLNLSLEGSVFGDKGVGRAASSAANMTVSFQSRTLQLQLLDNGSSLTVLNIAAFSGTEVITRGTSGFAASLKSPTVLATVGPMPFDMTLEVSSSAFLKGSSSSSSFIEGLKFPFGTDVFNLPSGYTVNGGTYLVNNRFLGNLSPVPEPQSLVLLVGGLLALSLGRRRACGAQAPSAEGWHPKSWPFGVMGLDQGAGEAGWASRSRCSSKAAPVGDAAPRSTSR